MLEAAFPAAWTRPCISLSVNCWAAVVTTGQVANPHPIRNYSTKAVTKVSVMAKRIKATVIANVAATSAGP